MSFNVYFEKDGGLWTEAVEDGNPIAFNFIEVKDEEEYLALTEKEILPV